MKILKISMLALLTAVSGIIGIAWTFGWDESLIWTILSKPIGIALLMLSCKLNEILKREALNFKNLQDIN